MRNTPVTLALLIAIAVMFVLQLQLPPEALVSLQLWPWGHFELGLGSDGQMVTGGFMPWQLVTYSFLHGGWAHLLFNGFALFQFGGAVERVLGPNRYAAFYFFCVVGAGLCQLLVTTAMLDPANPIGTVGASGGIFGLLLAFAIFYPDARIIFFLIPVPVPAKIAVIIYGAIELFLGLSGAQSGVAHFAHLGGLLFGWLLIRYWRKPPPPRSGTFV